MYRFLPALLSLTFFPFKGNAQDESLPKRYFTAGMNFGIVGWSPTKLDVITGPHYFHRTLNSLALGQVEDVDGNKHLALIANTSFGAAAGLLFFTKSARDFFGFQLEFQQNKACYEFDPPFLFSTGQDSFVKWIETDKYLKYAAALEYGHYLNESAFGYRYLYTRASFGQTFFHRNFNQRLEQGYQEDWTYNGTGMQLLDVKVAPKSYMIGAELGFKSFSDDRRSAIDLGVSYYAPFEHSYVREYEFFQQGASVGKSQVTFRGNTFLFNFRYTYTIPFKERVKKPKDTVKVRDQMVKKVNGRELDIQYKMKTRADSVVIEVWDKGRIDGDKISLYLNDELIERELELVQEKRKIVIHLRPGTNYLVMNALNLGSIPPNTAAMYIYHGDEKISVKISSTIGTSGAIEIVNKKW